MIRRPGLARVTAVGVAAALAAACATDAGVVAVQRRPSSTTTSTPATSTPATSTAATSTTTVPAPLPDSLFSELGNAGIDVQHYDLDLRFDGTTKQLSGTVALTIVATADLSTVTLDSKGPSISAVTVDGVPATFNNDDAKLRITPPAAVRSGTSVVVAVTYVADTNVATSNSGINVGSTGWFNTADGSYVLNEPDGARTWLPSNDHPSDKATWRVALTVDTGRSAISNGSLVGHTTEPAGERWVWQQEQPMATYLVLLLTGDYEVIDGPAGTPQLVSAAIAGTEDVVRECQATTREQLAYFEPLFGPYPFPVYGIAITDSFGGLAMETQQRSMFSSQDLVACDDPIGQLLLSHELAHQWFGNAVTLGDWGDIWLNESFATYGQWLWFDHAGISPINVSAEQGLMMRTLRPTGRPTIADMFGTNSYDGGAVVLHALRATIGDTHFFNVLRRWAQDNLGRSRRTADFIALAQQVSGRDLAAFFDQWLFAGEVPDTFPSAP